MKKFVGSMLVVIYLLFGMVVDMPIINIRTSVNAATVNSGDEDVPPPRLTVVNTDIPTAAPGSNVTIPFQLRNESSIVASYIDITPDLSGSPLEANSLSLTQHLYAISTGSIGVVNFNLNISEKAAAGSYIIPVKVSYEYGINRTRKEDTFSINVKVSGQAETSTPRLLVKDIYWSSTVLLPGETTALYIKLYNPSSQPLKDIKASIVGLKEDGFTLNGGSSSQYAASLDKDSEVTLTYYLTVGKKMAKGNYPLTLSLNYKDYTGKECPVDEQQFFLPIQGDDAPVSKTIPKIILQQYNSTPSIVKAGQNFKLDLSFLNTSSTKEVRNIKIYLTVNEAVEGANIFTPVNSSNTFFIDKIPPNGKVSKSLTMFTIPDAKQKTYTMTANFEYEYDGMETAKQESTELIGIPVTQQTNVDTSEIAFPPEAYTGSPVPVSFDFYNTGKTLLRNFMIKLEGEFQSQNGSYFVGNFDVGASDHFEGMIIPSAPGQVVGAIVISYEDPTGQKNEIRKDFTFNVMEMPIEPMPQDPGNIPQVPKETGIKALLKNKFLWIGVGIVIVTVVGFVIIRKRILKKREDMTLDE